MHHLKKKSARLYQTIFWLSCSHFWLSCSHFWLSCSHFWRYCPAPANFWYLIVIHSYLSCSLNNFGLSSYFKPDLLELLGCNSIHSVHINFRAKHIYIRCLPVFCLNVKPPELVEPNIFEVTHMTPGKIYGWLNFLIFVKKI